jgi:hypothetical protein
MGANPDKLAQRICGMSESELREIVTRVAFIMLVDDDDDPADYGVDTKPCGSAEIGDVCDVLSEFGLA